MKVESIIRRINGTTVVMDDKVYKFVPTSDDPRHLCEVRNQGHLGKFLQITEGFRLADQEDEEDLPDEIAGEQSDSALSIGDDENDPGSDTVDDTDSDDDQELGDDDAEQNAAEDSKPEVEAEADSQGDDQNSEAESDEAAAPATTKTTRKRRSKKTA